MKTSSCKAKGRQLQDWVAQKISELLNIPCGKDEAICGREMGQDGVDIRLIGEARVRFPFSVECKRFHFFRNPSLRVIFACSMRMSHKLHNSCCFSIQIE